jgi:hypothetical protein
MRVLMMFFMRYTFPFPFFSLFPSPISYLRLWWGGNMLKFIQKEGVAKNQKIAQEGEYQMNSGKFSEGTKNREGAVPGDGGRRTAGGL